MSSDPLSEPELEVLNDTASQFHLIHMIGAITALAVLSAIFAPLIRALDSEQATTALILVGVQLATATGVFYFGSTWRRRALQGAGTRLGQSFMGSPSRQYLVSTLLIVGALTLCLFVVLSSLRNSKESFQREHLLAIYQSFIVTSLSVFLLLHLTWKRHVGVVEFFEHGVALTPLKLTRWESVDVQPQENQEDTIQLIVTTSRKKTHLITVLVRVSPELRSYLLKHYSSADYRPPLKKRTLFDR
ncbi:hypothetical protein [Bremerella sp.]|uniref:hypothetical protein n=1 Tax=Bremerella sp. TaxID=2795602 RepID=UPI00391A4C9B